MSTEIEEITSSSSLVATSMNLLDLNEECFYEIFKHLHLADQVHFAVAHCRLREAYRSYYRVYRIALHKDDLNDVKMKVVRCFFELVGDRIEELIQLPYKDHERAEYATLVHQHCHNVRSIQYANTKISSKCLRKMLANMTHLRELRLINCKLDDTAMLGVTNLLHLEILNLSKNRDITGKHLHKLTKLTALNLEETYVDDENLIEICNRLNGLQKLDVTLYRRLSASGFRAIPLHCDQLEVLRTANHDGPCFIERLKNLKSLCVQWRDRVTMDYIRQISRLEHLQTINLSFGYSLTNDDLLIIVRGCPKLKYVNILYCNEISDEFVFEAIDTLKVQIRNKTRTIEDGPMNVMVDGTEIDELILNDSRYMNADDVLRLDFTLYYNWHKRKELEVFDTFY